MCRGAQNRKLVTRRGARIPRRGILGNSDVHIHRALNLQGIMALQNEIYDTIASLVSLQYGLAIAKS